jgi:hypothetical protein
MDPDPGGPKTCYLDPDPQHWYLLSGSGILICLPGSLPLYHSSEEVSDKCSLHSVYIKNKNIYDWLPTVFDKEFFSVARKIASQDLDP